MDEENKGTSDKIVTIKNRNALITGIFGWPFKISLVIFYFSFCFVLSIISKTQAPTHHKFETERTELEMRLMADRRSSSNSSKAG